MWRRCRGSRHPARKRRHLPQAQSPRHRRPRATRGRLSTVGVALATDAVWSVPISLAARLHPRRSAHCNIVDRLYCKRQLSGLLRQRPPTPLCSRLRLWHWLLP